VHLLGRFLSICAASSGRLDAGEKWLSHKHDAMRVAVAQRHRLWQKNRGSAKICLRKFGFLTPKVRDAR